MFNLGYEQFDSNLDRLNNRLIGIITTNAETEHKFFQQLLETNSNSKQLISGSLDNENKLNSVEVVISSESLLEDKYCIDSFVTQIYESNVSVLYLKLEDYTESNQTGLMKLAMRLLVANTQLTIVTFSNITEEYAHKPNIYRCLSVTQGWYADIIYLVTSSDSIGNLKIKQLDKIKK